MRIAIGIPVFQNYPPEVAHDYMRMMYHFGRRMPEHDFFLVAKSKSEQFRARNSIVTTALQFNCDYLLFLDDDHIFDWKEVPNHDSYGFLGKLLEHDKDIVGALYYHRTGEYRPVLMRHTGEPGKAYTFLTDAEIEGKLQRVDVQGGGCMLINLKVFDKITPPYFEPEMQTNRDVARFIERMLSDASGGPYRDGIQSVLDALKKAPESELEALKSLGTDIQLCRKAAEEGFEVWCDTSIVVGHLKQEKEIVHSENRANFIADNALKGGLAEDWLFDNWLKGYRDDVREYTGLDNETILEKAIQYNEGRKQVGDWENKDDYYRSLGVEQLCRQCYYHNRPAVAQESLIILKQFKLGFRGYGLDVGCGSAPVGYELVKKGHHMDFVDLDGAGAYEFLKWRVEKNKDVDSLEDRAGWSMGGPYDFCLFLDSIEHMQDWKGVLGDAIGRMKPRGILITNYFGNHDYNNPEHISMDKGAVSQFLADIGMVPKSNALWVKDDTFMGQKFDPKLQESAA